MLNPGSGAVLPRLHSNATIPLPRLDQAPAGLRIVVDSEALTSAVVSGKRLCQPGADKGQGHNGVAGDLQAKVDQRMQHGQQGYSQRRDRE